MRCLETEKLMGYAYRLLDKSTEWEIRAHLNKCPPCRGIVEQHWRLGRVLDEWKVREPTPTFDARVRQAVEEYGVQPSIRTFWESVAARGLALAALGVLIVAGVIGFHHIHASVSSSPTVAGSRTQTSGASAPAKIARLHDQTAPAHVGVTAAPDAPETLPAAAEDNDAQALEDYDLAANFDVLSELRKGEPRVAN